MPVQHGDAVPPGDLVQLGRQLRLLGLGISHLLGGGDDVHAPLHNKHQFVIDITGKKVMHTTTIRRRRAG